MLERRSKNRAITTFKSAYVKAADGVHFVTVRNMSETGACLEVYPGVAEGDSIELCLDSAGLRKGIEAWVGAGRFGVEMELDSARQKLDGPVHIPRSVRLPLSISASVFLDGRKFQGTIKNLAMRGTCISGVEGLKRGQLISIAICGRSFELATVRWVDKEDAGVLFARPMHRSDFCELVDMLQGRLAMEPSM